MVRVTLRPPSDWTLVGSMLGGRETKAPSWNGMSSEGEGEGWSSSQPVTCQTQHTKSMLQYILVGYYMFFFYIFKQTEHKYQMIHNFCSVVLHYYSFLTKSCFVHFVYCMATHVVGLQYTFVCLFLEIYYPQILPKELQQVQLAGHHTSSHS